MAFMMYKKVRKGNEVFYKNENVSFRLAGHNLIYKLWCMKNKPINEGWTITADNLLNEYDETNRNNQTHALIIDFHPSAKYRIGLVEIKKIHLYTYGEKENAKAHWSPIMLELETLFYNDNYKKLLPEEKLKIINEIPESVDREKIIEFLYLNGDDYSWNWGSNGMTNAAFLHKEAIDFFKDYFTAENINQ